MTDEKCEKNNWEANGSLSKEEIYELTRRYEALERDFKDMSGSLDDLSERRLRELAGPHLETMRRTPDATLKRVTDPDPKLRVAALRLADRHWNLSGALGTVYENMALNDSDNDVRDEAIRGLGTCFARTKDPRIGHLLASIALNGRLPDVLRLTAFTSLLRLHRNLDYSGTSPLVPVSLEEIDWAFVDEYYHGWRSAHFDDQGNEQT